jgi:hypothetical protein
LGKLLDRASPFVVSASIAPSACGVPKVALLRSGWVDFHLTECAMDGRGGHREAAMAERTGALTHGLHTMSRLESRGAAVRSCGNAWNTDAITARVVVVKEGDADDAVTFWWFGARRHLAVIGRGE